MFYKNCKNTDALVNRLIRLKNDLFNIAEAEGRQILNIKKKLSFEITETFDTIYHSQDETSLYNFNLSDNNVLQDKSSKILSDDDIVSNDNSLQDVENDIIINSNDGISESDISKNNDKIVIKKDKLLQVDDSEFINKMNDKKDKTIQIGDGNKVVDENAGWNDKTTQTGDGSEVIDKDTGKNDKKQQVDDSKIMEEKVYNTPGNTRNLFSLKDYKC
uniref:Uncharacterized protein n=1 Tax=Strongyloides venezuelensis TaxID=75913 RepID=A0A0K0FT00_STRVS